MTSSIRRVRIAFLVCLAPLLATVAPAAPAPPTNDDCLGCHEDTSLTREDGSPVGVDRAAFEGSIHGESAIACVDCHSGIRLDEGSHAPDAPPADCSSCHDGPVAEYATSAHASARAREAGSVAATCADCHGKHDILSAKNPRSRTHHLKLPDTCGACHGDAETIRKGHIAIGDVVALWKDSIHGQALEKSGLVVAPNCASCHGAHGVLPAKDPAATVHRTKVPETCGKCHEGVLNEYRESVHGRKVAAGDPKAPVCTDCHSAHGIGAAVTEGWKVDVIRECGTCHEQSAATYRDTYHGQVTNLGFTRVATCADCHGAHDIQPESDPRSRVGTARRLETCRSCHENATENFSKYDPHSDHRDPESSPAAYWTAKFMKILLGVTFSFFGLHTLLWIPRSFAERRRHSGGHRPEPPAGPPTEGALPRRRDDDEDGKEDDRHGQ